MAGVGGAEARWGQRGGERKSIVQLLEGVRGDEKLRGAVRWGDGNKIRDGLMKRAPAELSAYVSQFTVGDDELEVRTAEMINAAGMWCSHLGLHGAALRGLESSAG